MTDVRQKRLTKSAILAYLLRGELYMQGLKHRKKTSFLISRHGLFLACFTLLFFLLALTISQLVWPQQQTQGDAQMKSPDQHLPAPTPSGAGNLSSCLPPDIKLTDVVSAELISFLPPNQY